MLKGFAWLLAVAATGCGAAKPAVTAPPAAPPAASQPAPAPPAREKPTLQSQRAPFVDACMESIGSREYCECGFVQFEGLFKDVDFEKEQPKDDPRMGQLALKMKEACSSKFPEPKAREQFMQSCADNETKREQYCNCAWTELRKSLSVSDILSYPPGDAKYVDAKKGIPKACKGKYPVDLATSEYLDACKVGGQRTDKQCQCMWKRITKKFSVEQLVAGPSEVTKVADFDKCK